MIRYVMILIGLFFTCSIFGYVLIRILIGNIPLLEGILYFTPILAALGLIQKAIRRPMLDIKPIINTAKHDNDPRYGYFDIDVRNIGWKEATECELKLTIIGRNPKDKELPLFWREPSTYGRTVERPTVVIKGNNHFQTIIFDIKSTTHTSEIFLRNGAKIDVRTGDRYIFEFFVDGIPTSSARAKFLVNIYSWNCIVAEPLHWYSCKRIP